MKDNESYNLSEKEKNNILELLEKSQKSQVRKLFLDLHPANQADLITTISAENKEKLLSFIDKDIEVQFLSYLENDIKTEIVDIIGAKNSANAINKLEIDDAVEIIEDLKDEGIDEILNYVPTNKRIEIKEALSYEEDSVGRVMHQDFIAINQDWTVAQATRYLQEKEDLPEDFQYVIIVNEDYQPVSEISVSKIIISKKNTLISNIMPDLEIKKINVYSDQENAARLFSKYSLTYAPVVDNNNMLVGAISVGDIVDIIEEEAQEDLLLLGGVNNSNLYSSSFLTARSRIPWLFTSLITASMAAIIIALFSDEIEKAVVLAVLLPVIASLAGNAGTQALTVLVRSIATDEISNIGASKVLLKEACVGSLNGIFLSIIAAIICYLWKGDLSLSIILALAIFLTIILAGFFGAFIPIVLSKMKFDPAISSGVFLITVTDASSFFIFLGLASIFIL